VRTRFILSEVGIGLRRNLSMTIAMTVTVTISLALLGAALLTSKQISTMKNYWFDKIEVSVFLDKGTTQPEKNAIFAELQSLPEVEKIYYESSEQAAVHAKEIFKDQEALAKIATAKVLPESYRVKLKDPRKYQIVSSAVAGMPGVGDVIAKSEALERFFHFLTLGQRLGLGAALFILAAAVLLIFNTVRQSAFSRRRETGIMRLVGASDLYIRAPFVLEGAVAGLIGAIIAVGGVALFKAFVIDKGVHGMFRNTVDYIGWGAVASTVPWILLLGVVLAGLTSMVTLQRYLRV
jgi:cell division transport system permease protein